MKANPGDHIVHSPPPIRKIVFYLAILAVGFGAGAGAVWLRGTQPESTAMREKLSAVDPPQPQKVHVRYAAIDYDDLVGWGEDSIIEALPALLRTCEKFKGLDDNIAVGINGLGGTVGSWRAPCAAISVVEPGDGDGLRAALEALFLPVSVLSGDGDAEGTFTGYYEAELHGSLSRTKRYRVPIYGLPDDLIRIDVRRFLPDVVAPTIVGRVVERSVVPYHTREAIDVHGAVDDHADVLVWTDDPVDAHILHIQGSGRVKLQDGKVIRVGYADNNGHLFQGIGSILVQAGEIRRGEASMPKVRKWLKKNPKAAANYMNQNPRFIFFRRIKQEGPIGGFGVALTPQRSLAVDPTYVPLGAPVWLNTTDPDGRVFRRLMVAQDVGAAIKGPIRGDIFWGYGESAFAMAGRMHGAGRYSVLLPRGVGVPTHF